MTVESIAECSPWSILQYFWPALSDDWSWKLNFGLFLQVATLDRFYCIYIMFVPALSLSLQGVQNRQVPL